MNIFIVIATIALITTVGYITIQLTHLLPPKEKLLTLTYAYGLGIGIIGLQMFLYSILHLSWERVWLIFPWCVLVVYFLFTKRQHISFRLPEIQNFSLLEIILISGIVITSGYVIVEALLRPAYALDSWGFWLFEAKAFFLQGHLDPGVYRLTNIDYPPLMNLFETFVYVMIGKVDDTAILLTSSAFYLFLALLFFVTVKKRYGRKYALLFTFLFMTTQTFVRQGGRMEAGLVDLPIGYYAFICVTLLFAYLKKGSNKIFLLLNLFNGIILLIKFDGAPIFIVIELFALYHLYRHKLYKQLPLLLAWIIPFTVWYLFRAANHLSATYFTQHRMVLSMPKVINAFEGTITELLSIRSWNLVWILYFFSLLAFGIKKDKELFTINAVVLTQLVVYLGLYIFTIGNDPNSSIERLLVHIAPLAFLYLAIQFKLLYKNFLKNNKSQK